MAGSKRPSTVETVGVEARHNSDSGKSMSVDILCVIAHPDDELLCAGVVAHHSRHGRSVAIAVVTDGSGGIAIYDKKMSPRKLARTRRGEMLNSAKVLGVGTVEFLDFADSYDKPLADDLAMVTMRIGEMIGRLKPTILLTHGPDGEYGHPNHKDVSKCAREAVESITAVSRPLLYYCHAYWADAPVPRSNVSVKADYVFPVTGRNYEARRQVMLCHLTQMNCFLGFFGHNQDRECFHRVGKPNRHSSWFEVVPD